MAGSEDYRAASMERRRDAAHLRDGGRKLAAFYMLGYAVECDLKALLVRKGKKFPRSGADGHDLRALMEAAGFKRRDLPKGHRRRFVDQWNTALRYRDVLPQGEDFLGLYQGGCELIGRIDKELRRR